MGGCKNVKGGNPALDFPASIAGSARLIDLPERASFGVIEPVTNPNFYEPRNVIGGALYLKTAINNASCDAIVKNGDYSYVVGNFADGGQAFYMNYIELDENTVENPIQSGGATVFGSADRSLMDGFYCPVAAKNFMNSE